jgi:hypothetical protein
MELYTRDSIVWRCLVIRSDEIRAYLGYNIIAVHQLMGTAWLTKEKSGKSMPVTDSTRCINKSVLFSGDNDISEEVLNTFEDKFK